MIELLRKLLEKRRFPIALHRESISKECRSTLLDIAMDRTNSYLFFQLADTAHWVLSIGISNKVDPHLLHILVLSGLWKNVVSSIDFLNIALIWHLCLCLNSIFAHQWIELVEFYRLEYFSHWMKDKSEYLFYTELWKNMGFTSFFADLASLFSVFTRVLHTSG